MDLLFSTLKTFSSFVSLYSTVCLIRVLISWVPSLAYSPFGRVLAQITDPWLNLFRKLNPLKNSRVDISPIFAFAALMLISSILNNIALTRTFSIGMIISVTVSLIWSVISSLLTFFNILILIRLIATLFNKNTGQIWYSIDQMLYPIIQKILPLFTKNRFLQHKYQLMILLAVGLVLNYGIGFLIAMITTVLR